MEMIVFWAVGALLAAIILILLLRPLLGKREEGGVSRSEANLSIYREQLRELDADLAAGTLRQADYAQAKRELEARLLEDVSEAGTPGEKRGGRGIAYAIVVAVPLLAIGMYLLLGTPDALDPGKAGRDDDAHGISAAQIEGLVQKLAERMEQNPEDAEGWKMLGRSYSVLGRHKAAADAYAQAAKRLPADAQLLADYADSLAMAQGRSLEGEPEKLLQRALEADPTNLKALALAGTAAFERKDYATAVRYWERMLPLVAADSEDARQISANIDEARSLAGDKPSAGRPGASPPLASQPAAKAAQLSGEVRLAPELAAKVSPNDTVFIFARAAEGPQLPLAVVRKQVRDLPAAFSLDDSTAMAPDMALSNFANVVIAARISRSGNATSQPGDLQGLSAPVRNNAKGVTVVIDSEIR